MCVGISKVNKLPLMAGLTVCAHYDHNNLVKHLVRYN